MDNILELYQETIIEHSQSPRKSNKLKTISNSVSAKNPLCGDNVTIEVLMKEGIIHDISCQTAGCAISTAAGSIMAEEIIGKSKEDALKICDSFINAIKEKNDTVSESEQLKVLCKIADYPTRVKCAVLPWDALKLALK